MKKVFLDDLPRWEKGDGAVKIGTIKWKKSIGYKIKGVYDEINFEVEIVDYDGKYLYIKYLDKPIFKIGTGNFCECKLGKLLGKKTSDFKAEIRQVFKDNKRDITIINREHRVKIKNNGSKQKYKWYKYKCNKCGNENWIEESGLLSDRQQGCNVCCPNPQKIVLGINTIWDTDRWMCDLGVSEEDSKKYTSQSNKKITATCPDCGREKTITISNVYKCHSIGCICSDGISYPEKIMSSALKQLNINLKTEFSPKWCTYTDYKDKNKIKTGKYDFLLDNVFIDGKQVIIEMDGGFHYIDNKMSGQTKEESEYIDNMKDKSALKNGYEVIRIDCRYSELRFIKQNILNSRLSKILNLNDINWFKCEEFALSNRVKEACDLWNSGIKSTKKIGEIMRLGTSTVGTYLNKGSNLKWCDYNGKLVQTNNSKLNNKQVEIFKDYKSFGIFPSCKELGIYSEELFGVKLDDSSISRVARGKQKTHKGFTFKYISNLSDEEKIKYNISNIECIKKENDNSISA